MVDLSDRIRLSLGFPRVCALTSSPPISARESPSLSDEDRYAHLLFAQKGDILPPDVPRGDIHPSFFEREFVGPNNRLPNSIRRTGICRSGSRDRVLPPDVMQI